MGTTLTTISSALKRDYKDPLRDQLNSVSALYSRLDKNEEDVNGQDLTAYLAAKKSRNQGIGWRAERGALPAAKNIGYATPTVAMCYMYGRVDVTGQSLVAAKSSSLRFAKTLNSELEGMTEGVKQEVNRSMWGRGTGAIGRFGADTTDVAADTLIAVVDASRFEPGMNIDTFTTNATSGGTAGLDSATILQVDYRNNKISLEADPGSNEANDYIYREDSRGYVMMGLEGIVDGLDSAGNRLITTFQGITRSTNIWFEGNVLDSGGVDQSLTIDRVQRAFDLTEIVGGGTVSIILSGPTLRRAYIDKLVADRRYVETLDLDGGWKGLSYTGGGAAVPWVVDKMATAKQIYFLDESKLAIFRAADFDWMDHDGNVLSKVTGYDAYEAVMYSYMNFGAYRANVHTVLRDQIA